MKKTNFIILMMMSFNVFGQNWGLTGNSGTNSSTNFLGTTDSQDLVFKVGNQKKMTLGQSGTLKIGNFITPPNGIDDFKLAVDGRSYFHSSVNSDLIDIVNAQTNVDTGYDLIYGSYKTYQPNDVGLLTLSSFVQPTVWQTVLTVRANGKVGIGTGQYNCSSCSGYRLFVKDGIKTEKVKVEIAAENGWADYVFAKDYELMTLRDLEKFINMKGHLPEVPSTEEAIENGIELKAMNILLLKKVEELTLHLIQQNKRIEKLESNNKN